MIVSGPDLKRLVDEGVVIRSDGGDIAFDSVSIGLHLDNQFLSYEHSGERHSPPCNLETRSVELRTEERFDFPPGASVLACSIEQVVIPLDVMGFIQTKGSIARGFMMVHLTDGQIDPGYRGKITFELVNLGHLFFALQPGLPIARLFFIRLTHALETGYNGRYQDATSPTPMRQEAADR